MISGTEILVQSGQTTNIAIKCRSCNEYQKLTVPTAGLVDKQRGI